MSILSSANVTDVNPILKECTHMRLCINMLIFAHNLGNWLITETKTKNSVTHKLCHFFAFTPHLLFHLYLLLSWQQ